MRITDRYCQHLMLRPGWLTIHSKNFWIRQFYKLVKLYMRIEHKRRVLLGQPVGPGMWGECPTGPTGAEGPLGLPDGET